MEVTRRDFLKKAGLAGVGGSMLGLCPSEAKASSEVVISDDWMGVLVDLTACIGCRRCEAACQEANGFEIPTVEQLADKSVFDEFRRPAPDYYTVINEYPGPIDENGLETSVFTKTNCLHCNDPSCVSACLVGALRKQDNGAVTYDAWKCMGCRYCMVACPFQIPKYEYSEVLTPQVRKCTLCQSEGNPNKGGVPGCVKACPKECMTYGKRSELLKAARERIQQHPDKYVDHIYGEHEAGGTSWMYLSNVPFEEMNFLKVSNESAPRTSEAIQHGVFKHFVPPVAWAGFLGLAMWLTRPGANADDEEKTQEHHE